MIVRLKTNVLALLAVTFLLASFETVKSQNLHDTIIRLPAVEIRDSLLMRMTPRSTIETEMLERSSSADLGEILRTEPNISGIRKGGYAVDPVVRGFRYSQVNIHLDEGIHIEGGCPNRMDPVLSHVEPEEIQRIEIIRGPYMLQYGPSPAASIRVITRQDNPFGAKKMSVLSLTGYDANRNGIRQHLAVSGSGKNIYYRLAGSLKDFGNYTDGNGQEWASSYKKRSASADVGYKLSATETLNISYKGTFGRDVLFPALPMDEVADNTHIFSALYTHLNPEKPGSRFELSAFHSRVYHEMDNHNRPQYSAVVAPYTGLMQAVAKVNTQTTGTRLHWTHRAGELRLNAGVDGEYAWKDGTRSTRMVMQMDGQEFVSQKQFNLWKDAFVMNGGMYAGLSSEKGNWNYAATLRLDVNHSDSGDTLSLVKENVVWFKVEPSTRALWSMSASTSYRISNMASVTLGIARGSRSPDLQERYIKFLATGYDRYDYLGNPELKPEINYQADLMLDLQFNSVKAYVNLFRSDVRNFITGTLVPPVVARPVSMGAPGVKQFNNIDQALLYGFETGFTSRLTNRLALAFSAGYTYAFFPEMEKIVLENNQAVSTVLLKNDPIAEIPALDAMLRTSFSFFNNRLVPSVEIRAVADQKHVSEASYEESTPGYVLANVLVDYTFCKHAGISLGVNNIFDKAYYDHLNRKLLGSAGKLYEPGRTLYINLKIKI